MTETSKRRLGWRDLLIHAIVTLVALFLAGTAEEALVPLVLLASAVILFLRWKAPAPGPSGGDDSAALAELEERVRYLEGDVARMVELEERLDFAERLLAQRREAERLPPE
jgi:hypothetical protein